MAEKYITQSDLEEFKKQLIADLKNAEVELKSQNGNKLLTPVYHHWIHNTNARNSFDTPFQKIISCKQSYRIWDAVRKTVCAVCGVTTVAAIRISKQEFALDFCDKLCEFIYEYMKNHGGVGNG
jgi:hypothetical protein